MLYGICLKYAKGDFKRPTTARCFAYSAFHFFDAFLVSCKLQKKLTVQICGNKHASLAKEAFFFLH